MRDRNIGRVSSVIGLALAAALCAASPAWAQEEPAGRALPAHTWLINTFNVGPREESRYEGNRNAENHYAGTGGVESSDAQQLSDDDWHFSRQWLRNEHRVELEIGP